MTLSVEKRSGEIVQFNIEKIRQAVKRASAEAGLKSLTTDQKIEELCDIIEKDLNEKFAQESLIRVEDIHNVVEEHLMRAELYTVAKAYIIHRAEKAKQRTESISLKKLLVTKSNGTKVHFNPSRIHRKIQNLSNDLSWVTSDLIYTETVSNLYDGISTKDISELLLSASLSLFELDPEYNVFASRLYLELLRKDVLGYSEYEEDSYKDGFEKYIRASVKAGLLDKRALEFDLGALGDFLCPELDSLFPYIGLKTLKERYLLSNSKKIVELPQYFWMRVAIGLALNEEDKNRWAVEFYNEMANHRVVPSTPTLLHSCFPRAQLSSCYGLTVQDDLENIFKTFGDCSQLGKYSGGIGVDMTNVRATLAKVKSTKIESQGIIPFIKVLDSTTLAINRSGKRRGATCVYLEPWHLDIQDFLDLKRNTGDDRRRAHDLDTALWIPDLFMKRVQENGKWMLFSPDEVPDLHSLYAEEFERQYEKYEQKAMAGKIRLYKLIDAVDLFRKIIASTFSTGHPFLTFKDSSNIRNPQKHDGVINNTNLCTEIHLCNSETETYVCNLSSLNLKRFVNNTLIDWDQLSKSVNTQVRMLDNVIDICYYPTKEAETSNLRHRPIGLGVMGTQDMLFQLGLNFEDAESVINEVQERISFEAIHASYELGRDKGSYETFEGSEWSKGRVPLDTYETLCHREHIEQVDSEENLAWDSLRECVKHGVRNSNIMAIAPTSTISTIVGCYPSIEPQYSNIYVKSNMSGEFTILNEYLVDDLKKLNLWNSDILNKIKYYDGELGQIEEIPKELKIKYRGAFDVDQRSLLKLTAIRQKWIDQGQSHNIFYKGNTGAEIADLYMYAWKMGLKSTYYLRTLGASNVQDVTVKACSITDPSCESCQ